MLPLIQSPFGGVPFETKSIRAKVYVSGTYSMFRWPPKYRDVAPAVADGSSRGERAPSFYRMTREVKDLRKKPDDSRPQHDARRRITWALRVPQPGLSPRDTARAVDARCWRTAHVYASRMKTP